MKKLCGFIVFNIFTIILILGFSNSASAASQESIGHIDMPTANKTIKGMSTVRGWFLDKNSVDKVEIFIDRKIVGRAQYGMPRADVAKIYPDYKNQNSGYQYKLNTKKYKNGSHLLIVRATSKTGKESYINQQFNLQNAPAHGYIDNPKSNQTIKGTYTVRGWFVDGSGINKVEAFIDGKIIGRAQYGFSRPDVSNTFPEYKNRNSGYQYQLDTTKIKKGSHILLMKATSDNGEETYLTKRINVQNIPARGNIDNPKEKESIKGKYNIRGWFLDGSGVNKVEIFVDGKIVGRAQYGLLRPDVDKAYPQYHNKNSGYQYGLDTKFLKRGTHTLLSRLTSDNGEETYITRRVNVQNLPARGAIDSPNVKQIIKGGLEINGWFVDGSGVEKVEIFVDGKIVGRAQYGKSRLDVKKIYPEYQNQNSGYQYYLNTAPFSAGSHKLYVRETGKNGETKLIQKTFYISKLSNGALKKGIDVSHHQPPIDFKSVRNDGIGFVIAKATEGSESGSAIVDSTFKTNIENAKAAGLQTHAYHYFLGISESDSRKEAQWFLKNIKKVNFDGYLFVDIEDDSLTTNRRLLTNYIDAFLDELSRNGIKKMGIYLNTNFYTTRIYPDILKDKYPHLLIWRAAWHDENKGPGFETDIWQATSNGHVAGITGNVDIDYSYSTDF